VVRLSRMVPALFAAFLAAGVTWAAATASVPSAHVRAWPAVVFGSLALVALVTWGFVEFVLSRRDKARKRRLHLFRDGVAKQLLLGVGLATDSAASASAGVVWHTETGQFLQASCTDMAEAVRFLAVTDSRHGGGGHVLEPSLEFLSDLLGRADELSLKDPPQPPKRPPKERVRLWVFSIWKAGKDRLPSKRSR